MSGIKGAVEWAGHHPVPVALGVFAVGAVLLLVFRGNSGGDNGMGAFYAAQAAQAASGNALMTTQAQVKGATAIAQIAADRDVHLADTGAATSLAINTVQAQTDVNLANINASVLSQAELTRQQAQKQQFFLGVGIQQLLGQSLPYLLQDFASGDPTRTQGAVAAWQAALQGGTNYSASH